MAAADASPAPTPAPADNPTPAVAQAHRRYQFAGEPACRAPAWAGGNPGGDRYGAVAASDPTLSANQSPLTPASQLPIAPAAAGGNARQRSGRWAHASRPGGGAGGDPFSRSPIGTATLVRLDGSVIARMPQTPQATPPAAAAAAGPSSSGIGTAWPPTNDAGAGLANTSSSPPPTPQADPQSPPGMMPLQQMPVVTAAAAARRPNPTREYRERLSPSRLSRCDRRHRPRFRPRPRQARPMRRLSISM